MTIDIVKPTPVRAKRFARAPGQTAHPGTEAPASADCDIAAPQPRSTKTDLVLALLRREEGVTLAEIVEATGWLSHSARAALTGLRKKGHVIEKTKRGEVTYYTTKVPA